MRDFGRAHFFSGKVLECSLAKPQAEPKSAGGSNIQMPGLLPTYPPAAGFGFGGGAYGALGGGFGATGFAQVNHVDMIPLIIWAKSELI